MAYPHKWSPISYKSSAGQRKHIGQRPMLYRWTTPPTNVGPGLRPLYFFHSTLFRDARLWLSCKTVWERWAHKFPGALYGQNNLNAIKSAPLFGRTGPHKFRGQTFRNAFFWFFWAVFFLHRCLHCCSAMQDHEGLGQGRNFNTRNNTHTLERYFAEHLLKPRLWNSLPVDVQSAPSLTAFRRKLKTHLFRQSYSDMVF